MNSLEIQLVLTENCNLKCKYCYIRSQNTSMDFDTFHNFKLNVLPILMKELEFEKYHIVFFGGEPLLNFKLITEIVKSIKNDEKLSYTKIVTNGTLLNKSIVEFLSNNNIKISISYDGLWQNNRSGVDFDPNVIKIANVDKVHCMVYPINESTSSVLENYLYFRSLGIFPNFTIIEDNIWSEDDVKKICNSFSELTNYLIKEIRSGNITELFDPYKMIFARTNVPIVGMCAMGKSISLMPNGTLYPCARMGSEKIHQIEISSLNESINGIKTIKQFPKECLNCSFNQQCRSGCVVEQEKNNGPIFEVCTIKKHLIKECARMIIELKDNKKFLTIIEKAIR